MVVGAGREWAACVTGVHVSGAKSGNGGRAVPCFCKAKCIPLEKSEFCPRCIGDVTMYLCSPKQWWSGMELFCLSAFTLVLGQVLVVTYPHWKFLGLGEPESWTFGCP